MTELRFIGVEDGHLIVSGDDGRQHRVRIDDALREAVRPRPAERREAPKVPPREIQQLIRAGRSVDEVVEMTGADREDVARFEGPIRAERDYIVDQARAVPVRVRGDLDPLGSEGASFGSALDERLETLNAKDIAWDAWKDPETGWRVQLSFKVDELERDALWAYEPKTRSLSPKNPAATTLSQQGELASLGAPRLRAVDGPEDDGRAPVERSTSAARRAHPTGAIPAIGSSMGEARQIGARPESRVSDAFSETADLLEALRRRRGEREPLRLDEDELDAGLAELEDERGDGHPATGAPVRSLRPGAPAPAGRGAESDDQDDEDDRSPVGHSPEGRSIVEREVRSLVDRGTGAHDRIRRGSSGPRAVDVPLLGLDLDDEQGEDAPAPGPKRRGASRRREEAAAERARQQAAGGDEATQPAPAAPKPEASASAAKPDDADAPAEKPAKQSTTGALGRRRSRASMPSWDEIVFGTKREDD
ncbi:putative protein [Pseudoclavibacter triregionum]|nr:putative protein [Pseudoclavibacter triregionum]